MFASIGAAGVAASRTVRDHVRDAGADARAVAAQSMQSLRTPSPQAVRWDSDLSVCLCQMMSLCEVFLGHAGRRRLSPLESRFT